MQGVHVVQVRHRTPMLRVQQCPACDKRFKTAGRQVFCGAACYRDATRVLVGTRRPKMAQSLRRLILTRDGWRCGICGDPIDPSARWPSPSSVVVDHRVPRSHGGPDTPANLQAAHAYCNGVKGKRLGFEFA